MTKRDVGIRTTLVTGGKGLLARALVARSSAEWPVVSLDRERLDISDDQSVRAAFESVRPAVVVNAAAMTDVDGCERDPAAAARANEEGPRILARACRDTGAVLVHVSTDFVFDGAKRSPYTIDDAPNPISAYGRSKLAGEKAVLAELPEAIVARTSWVFGRGGKNFASRLFDYAAKTTTLKGITDMRSIPTYAPDLAERLLAIARCGQAGTYHVTGSGDATWFDVAAHLLEIAGRSDVRLLPTTVAELGLPAPRPPYSVMRCLVSEKLGFEPLRHWHEAARDFVLALQT